MIVSKGRHSYVGNVEHLFSPEVTLGNFSSVANGVKFHGKSNHPLNSVASFPFSGKGLKVSEDRCFSKGLIVIGNDVWIGHGATVLSGVTIGDGCVIGAEAVVTKDCRPYGVYCGNPAKLKKYRFNKDTIAALLKIKWWNWPDELIESRMKYFLGPVEEFVKAFAP